MKILIIHTAYTKRGGEDSVFESEFDLLKKQHEVETLLFQNKDLEKKNKIELAFGLFYNLETKKSVEAKIDSFKPDIIHIHNLFYIASPSILFAAKKKKIPVVLTLHNFRLICSGALFLRDNKICEICVNKVLPYAGVKYACFQQSKLKTAQLTLNTGLHKIIGTWKNKVDQFIVFSPFLKERFLNSSLKLKENQISIKPNFVEDFGFSPIDEREKYFLFIGRLSKEKGIDVLLNAAKNSEFYIEIIGTGELEEQVKKLAAENKNITFHGFKDRGFIISKLKKAQALLFPSIWYEGMPMTVLEAFSTGTPIIISNQKNIRDLVRDQNNGLLFENGNAEDLQEKMMLFEKTRASFYYENARDNYLKNYSPEINLAILNKIYESTLGNYGQ